MFFLAVQHASTQHFIHSLFHIERMLAAALAGLVIFCLVAVGMYVITQLMGSWRRSLSTSSRHRHLPSNRSPRPSIDAWRTGGQRYTDAFVLPRDRPRHPPHPHDDDEPPWHTGYDNFDDPDHPDPDNGHDGPP